MKLCLLIHRYYDFVRFFQAQTSEVEAIDLEGRPPLHHLINSKQSGGGSKECLKILLDNGADINQTDYTGQTFVETNANFLCFLLYLFERPFMFPQFFIQIQKILGGKFFIGVKVCVSFYERMTQVVVPFILRLLEVKLND